MLGGCPPPIKGADRLLSCSLYIASGSRELGGSSSIGSSLWEGKSLILEAPLLLFFSCGVIVEL